MHWWYNMNGGVPLLDLEVVRPPQTSCDCPFSECTFSVPRVRWYLTVWVESRKYREPFADVLRSESRNSRDIDPWIRGGRVDPDRGRMIGLSLERAATDGGLALQPWNAEKVARFLCARSLEDR